METDHNILLLKTSSVYDYIHSRHGLTRTHFNFLVVLSGMSPAQNKQYLIDYFQTTEVTVRQYLHILSKNKLIINTSKQAKERGVYTLTMKGKKLLKDVDIYCYKTIQKP